jgi:hypothetical protein
MIYTNIILIIILFIFIISYFLSIYNYKNQENLVKIIVSKQKNPVDNLKNLYNNLDYDNNGIPLGGFLVTMINTNIICKQYTTSGPCDKTCNTDLDIGDIDNLVTLIMNNLGTNCLSLNTTYFRSDLPPYAFGPLPKSNLLSQDLVIGIIIDVRKIWQYIACMYTLDSGSTYRYNKNEYDTGSFQLFERNDKIGWNNYLNSNKSKYLGFAGCGKISVNPKDSGLKSNANSFFVNDKDRNLNIPNQKTINHNFGLTDDNLPFSKFQWRDWIEKTKQINKLTNNETFLELECNDNNGYRENEVDLILPSAYPFNNQSPCTISKHFKKIWNDSVIGIFTNAKTNCSKKTNIADGCFSCNGNCCCNEEYHVDVVKKLVKIFNKNNNKNIHGYKLDTININDFNNVSKNLEISLIE